MSWLEKCKASICGTASQVADAAESAYGTIEQYANNVTGSVTLPKVAPIPLSKQGDAILNTKFRDMAIASSHNSYLDSVQVGGGSSAFAVYRTMLMGARCVELDVFCDATKKEPVVSHGTEVTDSTLNKIGITDIKLTKSFPFEDVIKLLAGTAFILTNDPLIICIENNTNKVVPVNDRMGKILATYFGARLIPKGTDILNMPMKSLLGKVIILTGGGDCGAFSSTLTAKWSNSGFSNKNAKDGASSVNKTICTRIYPNDDLSGILSMNYDAIPFLKAGASIVAVNYQKADSNLASYLSYFSKSSFVPKQ